jgi:hypothetical protein
VKETVILPEMLAAGVEAMAECKARKLTPYETAIAVYLAMRDIEEICYMRRDEETLH